MDWDRIEGSWKEFRGKAQSRWGELTETDLIQVEGRQQELIGRLQTRYGLTKDEARQEVDSWLEGVDHGLLAQAAAAKHDVMQVAGNFTAAFRKSVRTNPRATIAMAAVLGFVLGALWKS